MLSKMDFVAGAGCPSKNLRMAYLQAPWICNQWFFKNSKAEEFFALLYLVFSIFFRNFKIAFWLRYKPKTCYALKNGLCGKGPRPGLPRQKTWKQYICKLYALTTSKFLKNLKRQNFSQNCV
jgi:hypothetical protein